MKLNEGVKKLTETEVNAIEIGYLLGVNHNYDNMILDDIINYVAGCVNMDEKAMFGLFCKFMACEFQNSTGSADLDNFLLYNVDELLMTFVWDNFELERKERHVMNNFRTAKQLYNIIGKPSTLSENTILKEIYGIITNNYMYIRYDKNIEPKDFERICNDITKSFYNNYTFKIQTLREKEYKLNEIIKDIQNTIYFRFDINDEK